MFVSLFFFARFACVAEAPFSMVRYHQLPSVIIVTFDRHVTFYCTPSSWRGGWVNGTWKLTKRYAYRCPSAERRSRSMKTDVPASPAIPQIRSNIDATNPQLILMFSIVGRRRWHIAFRRAKSQIGAVMSAGVAFGRSCAGVHPPPPSNLGCGEN